MITLEKKVRVYHTFNPLQTPIYSAVMIALYNSPLQYQKKKKTIHSSITLPPSLKRSSSNPLSKSNNQSTSSCNLIRENIRRERREEGGMYIRTHQTPFPLSLSYS